MDTEHEAIGIVKNLINKIDEKAQDEERQEGLFIESRALADKVIGKKGKTRLVKVKIYGKEGDLYLEQIQRPSDEGSNNYRGDLQICFKEKGPVPNDRRVTRFYYFDKWSISSVDGKLTTDDQFVRVNRVLEFIRTPVKKTQSPVVPMASA